MDIIEINNVDQLISIDINWTPLGEGRLVADYPLGHPDISATLTRRGEWWVFEVFDRGMVDFSTSPPVIRERAGDKRRHHGHFQVNDQWSFLEILEICSQQVRHAYDAAHYRAAQFRDARQVQVKEDD